MMKRFHVIGFSMVWALLSASTAAFAAQATVSWNANTESDLAGYRLFRSTSSLLNVTVAQAKANAAVIKTEYSAGTQQCVVSNLTNGTTYYFRLTAYDTDGNESPFNVDAAGQPAEAVFTPGSVINTATPTRTVTRTATRTITRTATRTITRTATRTITRTATRTVTRTASPTPRSTTTPTPIHAAIGTAIPTPIHTLEPNATKTCTPPPTATLVSVRTPDTGVIKSGLLSPANRDGINDRVTFDSNVIEVTVLDMKGHVVYHAQNNSGIAPWAGTDQQGRVLSSGVYILKMRLQSGEVKMQRQVIVK